MLHSPFPCSQLRPNGSARVSDASFLFSGHWPAHTFAALNSPYLPRPSCLPPSSVLPCGGIVYCHNYYHQLSGACPCQPPAACGPSRAAHGKGHGLAWPLSHLGPGAMPRAPVMAAPAPRLNVLSYNIQGKLTSQRECKLRALLQYATRHKYHILCQGLHGLWGHPGPSHSRGHWDPLPGC